MRKEKLGESMMPITDQGASSSADILVQVYACYFSYFSNSPSLSVIGHMNEVARCAYPHIGPETPRLASCSVELCRCSAEHRSSRTVGTKANSKRPV